MIVRRLSQTKMRMKSMWGEHLSKRKTNLSKHSNNHNNKTIKIKNPRKFNLSSLRKKQKMRMMMMKIKKCQEHTTLQSLLTFK